MPLNLDLKEQNCIGDRHDDSHTSEYCAPIFTILFLFADRVIGIFFIDFVKLHPFNLKYFPAKNTEGDTLAAVLLSSSNIFKALIPSLNIETLFTVSG